MRGVIFILLALLLTNCRKKNVAFPDEDAQRFLTLYEQYLNSEDFDSEEEDEEDWYRSINTVAGHDEQMLITGNFTGTGIDTLYVVTEEVDSIDNMYEHYKFYARSNNPDIPEMELFGCGYATPLLVYEGDVDGDGKDEWGYLHTWLNSQWRQYRIYNYDAEKKEWRFLYYDVDKAGQALLDTSEWIRASGVDIVEKGPRPGYIIINYFDLKSEEIRDTIVRPNYTPISENAW